MKKRSNLYIFLYASGMVIIVASLLALASTSLKPAQKKNIETEKKLDILKSFGKALEADAAKDKHKYVNEAFTTYIVEQYAVNSKGNKIEGMTAFEIDLKVELAKPLDSRNLPVYKAKLDDASIKYILPVRGRGLWGPIWGYISLNDDFSTIFGASFSHQAETPGLGAEISTPDFQEQFKGKSIFSDSTFVSVAVVKGVVDENDPHGVDGISGGTITCKALEQTIYDCLSSYQTYIKNQKK